MKYWVIGAICSVLLGACSWYLLKKESPLKSPVNEAIQKITEKPLDKYSIENLGKRAYASEIFLDEPIATTSAFTVYKFYFDSDGKRVTGLAHIPNGKGPFPVIVQFRGYVEQAIYQSGVGTKRSAEVFAQNGFISLAPDGLGYGGSESPSVDVFEERFQTFTTGLNLLAAAEKFPIGNGKVGIWGHSNGGQVALTILEISQPYPTVLWAPVSKPFPYSILYYTDDIDDHGKALRKVTANFEKDYDVEKYSLTNNLDRITAPIELHQGIADEAVPQKWSDDLAKKLKDVKYYVYPGADHNMAGAWNTVMERNIKFFKERL